MSRGHWSVIPLIVTVGQAEPKTEYQCRKLLEEEHDWGMKESVNKAGAIEQLTQAAVQAAPGKGANYAYLHLPGEATVGVVNVNAFNDPEVVYYQCANLPAPK